MEMMYYQVEMGRASCPDSLQLLEADIQQANALYVPFALLLLLFSFWNFDFVFLEIIQFPKF